jgi:outer membrane protein assembly factor BamD
MGQTLEHLKTPKDAVPYYSRLVRDFPLSPRVEEAKGRLVALGEPVPKPSKATLARAEADAARLRSKSLFGKLTTAMASTPDTSATLRGPVEIGGAPASGVEVAKRTRTAPSLPNAAIIAQPVGDASLNSGKAVESKPPLDNSGKAASAKPQDNQASSSASESNSKAPENKANSSSNESGSKAGASSANSASQDQSGKATPTKKKSRFHILKKVIKPI